MSKNLPIGHTVNDIERLEPEDQEFYGLAMGCDPDGRYVRYEDMVAIVAKYKKNAERYLWLRDQASHFSPNPWSLFRPRMTYMLDPDCWDSAIDEAMNAVIEGKQ